MTLLKDIIEYTDTIRQDVEEPIGATYGDTNMALLKCNSILIPLEIMIRYYELRLKRERILMKQSEDYDSYKTIKAKDEQVILDTYDISEAMLNLKLLRNKLRYKRDYYEYKLQQELKEVD